MKVSQYDSSHHDAVYRLWNESGVRQGFIPLNPEEFDRLIVKNEFFSPQYAFVSSEAGSVRGFICGCLDEKRPEAEGKGLFTCLLLETGYDTESNADALLKALEHAFRAAGKKKLVCSYINPMRLPWTIPDTKGHQHNNAPGIAVGSALYRWMTALGYKDRIREGAMYLDLAQFEIPQWVTEKEKETAVQGYRVEWFDADKHKGLKDMVDSLHNSMWSEEIPYAAQHINMLVAARDEKVVGFAGPVYPEKSMRGYFAGIAVAAEHEKHGLGTLLFYRLCAEEKKAGAQYMSLFTGIGNRAADIYKGAGFKVKRIFAILEKGLDGQEEF